MARPSSVRRQPDPVREEAERLVREGKATIDEIVARLREMGGDVSRSAVGRFKQKAEASLRKYREAQEVTGIWVKALDQDPGGDVGRLVAEMLKTLAFQTMTQMGEGDEAPDPKDIMFLASAVKNMEGTQKLSIERELRARERARAEAADAAEGVAKAQGLSRETIERFRGAILGVPAPA